MLSAVTITVIIVTIISAPVGGAPVGTLCGPSTPHFPSALSSRKYFKAAKHSGGDLGAVKNIQF